MDATVGLQIFDGLSPALAKTLRGSSRVLCVPEGGNVFVPGQECSDFLIVRSGIVRVDMVTVNGDTTLLYRLRPGDACVLTMAALLANRRYSAIAVAETAVEAVAVSARAFDDLIATSPHFRRLVFAEQADRILDMAAALGAVLFESIDQRLARRLAKLANGGVSVPCTHAALAQDIGTAREVVSRRLEQFAAQGWIAMRRGAVTIRDAKALSALVRTSSE